MKKIIVTAVVLLVVASCTSGNTDRKPAQKDSVINQDSGITFGRGSWTIHGHPFSEINMDAIFVDEDTIVSIQGDTMRAITKFAKYYLKEQEKYFKGVVMILGRDTSYYRPGDTIRATLCEIDQRYANN